MLLGNIKKSLDEITRSKLSDAYLAEKSWLDIASIFPEVTEDMYNEIKSSIDARLEITSNKLKPNTYYRGIGVEAENHPSGLILIEIYKSCPGEQLGIKAGDIVTKVKINQIWINLDNISLRESLKILRKSDSISGIQIEVIRDGQQFILGKGLNIETKIIDAKRKFPMNFTAKTLGKNLLKMQISNGISEKHIDNKHLPYKKSSKSLEIA